MPAGTRAALQRACRGRPEANQRGWPAVRFSSIVGLRFGGAPPGQIETTESEIANIERRLTDCCERITGACTLLDKVGGGMIARPRS